MCVFIVSHLKSESQSDDDDSDDIANPTQSSKAGSADAVPKQLGRQH